MWYIVTGVVYSNVFVINTLQSNHAVLTGFVADSLDAIGTSSTTVSIVEVSTTGL